MRHVLLCGLLPLLAVAAGAAETLKVGQRAPSLEARDQDGQVWKLADATAKGRVIVFSYPKDDTPGCTKQACGFRDQLKELGGLGVSVVGISRDDAESQRAFRAKHGLNFPLLLDTDGRLTEAFGAAAPDRPRSRRVSFLIAQDGTILHVTDAWDARVHLDELRAAVRKP